MKNDEQLFADEWRRPATQSANARIRAIAQRLLSVPIAMKFFPYAGHGDLHVSRNTSHPWDNAGLPWICGSGPDEDYQAVDASFVARAQGPLDVVVPAFLELLARIESNGA